MARRLGTTGIYAVQLQQILDAAGLTIEFGKKDRT